MSGVLSRTASDETSELDAQARLPFFIAGVGASAGGLEALEEFFRGVVPGAGIAYVVVQHLSPDFKSMMTELLQRHTRLRVTEVEHDTVPVPDRVYILPAKKALFLENGRFKLADRETAHLTRPINLFFESLANGQGDQCAGIILSGTGTDGTHGIRVIKESGGLTMAQDPRTAKFDGMPNSAIATDLIDFVLPAPAMATRLASFVTHPVLGKTEAEESEAAAAMRELMQHLRRSTGISFGSYKPGTIWRRVQRRTSLLGHASISDYAEAVRQDEEEAQHLCRELLIGVTQFFRDPDAWKALAEKVLPRITERVPEHETIRVWVAGCATGEEAYTLGMLLHSHLVSTKSPTRNFRLFATDIRRDSLSFARRGEYPEAACSHVPLELRERYFERQGENLVVRRSLRDAITFAPHNLLTDPPFTRLDLATCRNMLIYLDKEGQQRVVARLRSSLRDGAFLMLGSSEAVTDSPTTRFRHMTGRGNLFVALPSERAPFRTKPELHDLQANPAVKPSQTSSSELLYEAVLARYVPPGVAVDSQFSIVQVFGRVAPYVTLSPGRLSLNLLRMVPQPLSVLLSSAGKQALSKGSEVRIPGVHVGDSHLASVDVRLIPTHDLPGIDTGLLIFFEEQQDTADEGVHEKQLDDAAVRRIRELEDELVVTRENLHAAVQDLEGANEELQATNEELTASNEELQSTNEELQSVNEELYSVNTEYQQKISELEELNADLESLLTSIDAGVLFLDSSLCIRRYNEVTTRFLPVRREDVGRPIREIAFHANYPELEADVQTVLAGQDALTRELDARDNTWWLVSMRAFAASPGDKSGVILTLRDITGVKRNEINTRRLAATHELAAELTGVGYAIVDLDEETIEFSRVAQRLLGRDEAPAMTLDEFMTALGPAERESADKLFERLRAGEALPFSVKRQVPLPDGRSQVVRMNVRPEREPQTGNRLILFAFAPDPG